MEEKSKKKNGCAKWAIWLIAIFAVLALLGVVFGEDDASEANTIIDMDNADTVFANVIRMARTAKFDEATELSSADILTTEQKDVLMDTILHLKVHSEIKRLDAAVSMANECIGRDKLEEPGRHILTLGLIGSWDLLAAHQDSNDTKEVMVLRKSLAASSARCKIESYPILRRTYAKKAKDVFWEEDIEVKYRGKRNTTITFIGGAFFANRNIKSMMDGIGDDLRVLRFKRAEFKPYEGAEHQYFDLYKGKDSDIIK